MRVWSAMAGLGCAALLAACGESNPTGGNTLQPPPGPAVGADTITIVDNAFGPATVLITTGGTVTWIWNMNNLQQHNVRWGAAPMMPPGSPTQATGTPFEVTFAQAGTYEFVCSIHAGMQGAVFVQ